MKAVAPQMELLFPKSTTSLPRRLQVSSVGAATSTELATRDIGYNGEAWLEFSCSWLDEVYDIQNGFYWRHINSAVILALYAIICTFGALANLFVIIAFVRTPSLRNLRNYFIMNLACSDLMLCALTAPATLFLTMNLFWPFGNIACQMVASIQAVNTFVSCLTLVLIAADRFLLLTLCPVRWRLAATAPLVCYSFVWLTSIFVAAPYFLAVSAEEVSQFDPWDVPQIESLLDTCGMSKPKVCAERTWHRLPFSRRSYMLTVFATQYILPLSALAFAYSRIGTTIVKRVKDNATVDPHRRHLLNTRNRRALLLLLLLVLVYAVAWLPINAYNMLNVFGVIEFSQYRYIFCYLIGLCSTCVNPLIYALINDSFRSAFAAMLQPLLSPCAKCTLINGCSTDSVDGEHIEVNGLGAAEQAPKQIRPTLGGQLSNCRNYSPYNYIGPAYAANGVKKTADPDGDKDKLEPIELSEMRRG